MILSYRGARHRDAHVLIFFLFGHDFSRFVIIDSGWESGGGIQRLEGRYEEEIMRDELRMLMVVLALLGPVIGAIAIGCRNAPCA